MGSGRSTVRRTTVQQCFLRSVLSELTEDSEQEMGRRFCLSKLSTLDPVEPWFHPDGGSYSPHRRRSTPYEVPKYQSIVPRRIFFSTAPHTSCRNRISSPTRLVHTIDRSARSLQPAQDLVIARLLRRGGRGIVLGSRSDYTTGHQPSP